MFVGRDDNVTLSQRERDITTEREIIIATEREREREITTERLQQMKKKTVQLSDVVEK